MEIALFAVGLIESSRFVETEAHRKEVKMEINDRLNSHFYDSVNPNQEFRCVAIQNGFFTRTDLFLGFHLKILRSSASASASAM